MKIGTFAVALLLLLTLLPAEVCAGEELVYSVIFPGLGQLRSGQYGRGMIFSGGELLSLIGLFISDLQYGRAAEDYTSARAAYLAADYIGDAEYYFERMNKKWDDAERLQSYRNAFLGAAVGIWVVNIVDMALGDDRDEPVLSMTVDGGVVFLTKGFAF
jgi:hypothetical protein